MHNGLKKNVFKIFGGKSAAVQATDVSIIIANDGIQTAHFFSYEVRYYIYYNILYKHYNHVNIKIYLFQLISWFTNNILTLIR